MPLLIALMIVFACLSVGQAVVMLTGLRLPASIIGLLLLFALLQLQWVRVEQVRTLSNLLLDNLILLLIPACVAVMDYLDVLGHDFFAIAVSSIASTLLVLWISAVVHAIARNRTRR